MKQQPYKTYLDLKEKIGYAIGDVSFNFFFVTFRIFLFYYYTDVYGLSAATVGTMFLVTRLWDMINDPLMGIIADRTKTRWGSYRPWLLWMAIPYAVAGYAIFASPEFSPVGKIAYAYVTYTIMMTLYTSLNVPYSALTGVMTPSSRERTVLSSYRFVGGYLGGLILTLAVRPLVRALGDGDEVLGFKLVMMIFAVLSVGLLWVTFLTTKERVRTSETQEVSVKKDLGVLLKNYPWLLLFGVTFLTTFYGTIHGASVLHYFKYWIGDDGEPYWWFMDKATIYMSVNMLALIVGVSFTKYFNRYFDKRMLFISLTAIVALAYLGLYAIPRSEFGLLCAVGIVMSLATGPTNALIHAMYADTADYGEWKLGRRTTGLIFSAAHGGNRLGMTLGGAAVGWLFGFMGFVSNVEQTESSLHGMRIAFSLIPAGLAVGKLVLLFLYPLRDADMEQIEADLEARKGIQGVKGYTA